MVFRKLMKESSATIKLPAVRQGLVSTDWGLHPITPKPSHRLPLDLVNLIRVLSWLSLPRRLAPSA